MTRHVDRGSRHRGGRRSAATRGWRSTQTTKRPACIDRTYRRPRRQDWRRQATRSHGLCRTASSTRIRSGRVCGRDRDRDQPAALPTVAAADGVDRSRQRGNVPTYPIRVSAESGSHGRASLHAATRPVTAAPATDCGCRACRRVAVNAACHATPRSLPTICGRIQSDGGHRMTTSERVCTCSRPRYRAA